MKKSLFCLVIFVFSFSASLSGLIVMNDIVPAFSEGEQKKIEDAVVKGATHFLQAKSDADLLLKEYEKSSGQDINPADLLGYVEKVMGELEIARLNYAAAVTIAQQAGYGEKVQGFKGFDYQGLTREKGLNPEIMNLVAAYLGAGDILGAYGKNLDHIDAILVLLGQMKKTLAAGDIPELSMFWGLLQDFSQASLFGNYCTLAAREVFKVE